MAVQSVNAKTISRLDPINGELINEDRFIISRSEGGDKWKSYSSTLKNIVDSAN